MISILKPLARKLSIAVGTAGTACALGFSIARDTEKEAIVEHPETLWIPPSRSELIDKLKKETFDLLIIGGGATGTGCALDAATRGLNVALVERGEILVL